eukprot:CAMPEP_0176036068 /NCGR_PEP_ID=MMETSP0120_2-20121206/17860_1 /TAXON_ID=160619 /ORGANISM="Kryptoperidinium foliaceum, Strain CCMP 1326" /LENGTH=77 /DNA_ID=CAMNT_0017369453 /DNA_START=371 /DNA_END=602 /DNA_ORIENTATION=-
MGPQARQALPPLLQTCVEKQHDAFERMRHPSKVNIMVTSIECSQVTRISLSSLRMASVATGVGMSPTRGSALLAGGV